MLENYIEKITSILIERQIVKPEDKEIIIYGLNTGIELIFNIITTIILGLLFDLVIESLIFLLSFSYIRIYAGGYHCQKAISCYFFSTAIVILMLFILKITPIEYTLIISTIILLFSIPILIRFSPTETINKPLDEDEFIYYHKKMLKNLIIEIMLIYLLFIVGGQIIAYTISIGILVSALLVILNKLSLG